MRRLIGILFLMLLLFTSRELRANQRVNVLCAQSGNVMVQGLPSTNLASIVYPRCLINVYFAGTTNRATIYADNINTPLSNPFQADSKGNGFFYPNSGRYDIVLVGGGLPNPVTIGDVLVQDVGGGGGGGAGYPGVASDGANGLTVTGAVAATDFKPGVTPWVDCRAYGCVGDDATDNSTQIQNAINAACTSNVLAVYFPPGFYRFSATLLPCKALKLMGTSNLVNANSVRLHYTGNTTGIQLGSTTTPFLNNIVSVQRLGGVSTFTVSAPLSNILGGSGFAQISGVTDASFNSPSAFITITGTTTFTQSQIGSPDTALLPQTTATVDASWEANYYDYTHDAFAISNIMLKCTSTITTPLLNGSGTYATGATMIAAYRVGRIEFDDVTIAGCQTGLWGIASDLNVWNRSYFWGNSLGFYLGPRSDQLHATRLITSGNDTAGWIAAMGATLDQWVTDSDGSPTTNPMVIGDSRFQRAASQIFFDSPWLENYSSKSATAIDSFIEAGVRGFTQGVTVLDPLILSNAILGGSTLPATNNILTLGNVADIKIVRPHGPMTSASNRWLPLQSLINFVGTTSPRVSVDLGDATILNNGPLYVNNGTGAPVLIRTQTSGYALYNAFNAYPFRVDSQLDATNDVVFNSGLTTDQQVRLITSSLGVNKWNFQWTAAQFAAFDYAGNLNWLQHAASGNTELHLNLGKLLRIGDAAGIPHSTISDQGVFGGAGISVGAAKVTALVPPGTHSVGPTCTGTCTTTYGYRVTGVDINGGETLPNPEITTLVQAATLDATHFNTIILPSAFMTAAVSCNVYRTTGGTLGLIANVPCSSSVVIDNGLTATTAPPTINTTGSMKVGAGTMDTTGIYGPSPVNIQSGGTYTLVASDNGKVIQFTSAANVSVNVTSAAATAGFNCLLVQRGAGNVAPIGTGVVIRQRQALTKTAGVYAVATLVCDLANDCILGGDLQ
jgi:hypothetical protein